jgi:glutaredoxin
MTRARLAFALIALACAASAAHAQEIYRWVDSQGRVHLTDTPPPPNAREMDTVKSRSTGAAGAPVQSAAVPYELSVATKDFPVVLYTSPTCKEACQSAREALNKRGVPFKETQVWDEQSNAELKRVSGANDVPTLLVGRSVQRGFEQGAFDALLDAARYPKAGAAPTRTQAAPQAPEGYVSPAEREAMAKKAQSDTAAEAEEPRGPYSPGSKAPPRRPATPPQK